MPKVSDEYKEKKKLELLESALECFAEKGYFASTMDDIVASSDTSKGLVYNYFSSKEELYQALIEQLLASPFENLLKKFGDTATAEEKIRELIESYRRSINSHPQWIKLIKVFSDYYILIARQENLRKMYHEQYQKYYQAMIVGIVQEGIDKGEFNKNTEPEVVSNLFWSMIDGLCLHFLVIDEQEQLVKNLDAMEKMILGYLLEK